MDRIDLHTHSNKSDGSLSPAELVRHAAGQGLLAIALTDHDTTEGIDEAMEEAEKLNIELIPGIEFSTEYEGKDIHIVGLYIDHHSEYFKRRLVNFVNGRTIRNKEMCRRLTEHGMPVEYEELAAEYPDCVITRSHFAGYLLRHGYVKSRKEAFDRYIGDGCSCFVPRKKITPMRAVEIILKAGGFPVLAHPVLYGMRKECLERLVVRLKAMGLQGIEVLYSTYAASDERDMRRLAAKYDLCVCGGSDFHGKAKPGLELGTGYGNLFVPEKILWRIKERREWMKDHPEELRPQKILFTDLDGTLLDGKKQISDYTRKVLADWTAAGHKLVLCSGRDINSVTNVKEYLKLPDQSMYLIGYNGGEIFDCEKKETLYRVTVSIPQVRHIMEVAGQYRIHCHAYTSTHIVSPADNEQFRFYRWVIKTPVIYSEDVTAVMTEGSGKCIAVEIKDHDRLEAFRQAVLPWAEEEGVTVLYSNPNYLEFIPAGSGKGASVLKLCEILGIDPCFSVAAGDEQNDLSMIEASGMGIAMVNGNEQVKMAATVITQADNDHDGLAKALVDLI